MNLAILISGRGSNMAALLDYAMQGETLLAPALVLADNETAPGLDIARARNIPARAIPHGDEATIIAALDDCGAEIICLAGYMRILSADFCARYHGRLLNIHPSLLPRHKGLDTHARALAAGDSEHGCSVHFVSSGVDEGTVIAQKRISVADDDTAETLAAKVLAQEHQIYPLATAAVAAGLVRLGDDGKVQHRAGILRGRIKGMASPPQWPPE